MTTLPGQPTELHIPVLNIRFNWQDFVQEHLTRSWWLTGWLLVLTLFTVRFVYGRLIAAPNSTTAVLVLWAATVILTVMNEVSHRHNALTRWLKDNLYSSITNIQVTLIIVLGILAAVFGLYYYAWVNASFYTVPAPQMAARVQSVTADEYCFRIGRIDPRGDPLILLNSQLTCFPAAALTADSAPAANLEATETPFCFDTLMADPDNGLTCFVRVAADPAIFKVTNSFTGANWGAVAANMPLLMIFRFDRSETWRIWATLVMLVLLIIPSQFVYRANFPNQTLRRWLTYAWLVSPVVAYLLLRGVPAVPFETTNLSSVLGGMYETVFGWRSYTEYALETGEATMLNGVVVVADPVTGEPARDSSGALVGNVPPLVRLIGAVWLNRSLYGVLSALLFGGLLWLLRRYYPPQEREAEAVRIGRFLLQVLFGISAVLATLALIKTLSLLLGSMTWPVETAGGLLIRKPIFGALDPDINWGGFLLTLIITVFAIVVSFPIGLVLALGRRSNIPGIPAWLTYSVALIVAIYFIYTTTPSNLAAARNDLERILAYWPLLIVVVAYLFQRSFQGNVLRAFSTLYIEFVRGVPLIAVLFLATQLFPLLIPRNMEVINMWRVIWGFTLFSAAYLAENVRGGLQAIPKGQYEAADSLGLGTFDKYRLIILPQAIRIVIPALVGQFIGLFKDTSLVAIVGLLDVLGIANTISAQPEWLGVRREAYLFLAFLYFAGSAVMAGYSRRLEKRMGLGER